MEGELLRVRGSIYFVEACGDAVAVPPVALTRNLFNCQRGTQQNNTDSGNTHRRNSFLAPKAGPTVRLR